MFLYVNESRPLPELVTRAVWPNQDCPGTMCMIAPFQNPSGIVSAESYSVPLEEPAEILSATALAGWDRSSVVFGHRASTIDCPSTNTSLLPIPDRKSTRLN